MCLYRDISGKFGCRFKTEKVKTVEKNKNSEDKEHVFQYLLFSKNKNSFQNPF